MESTNLAVQGETFIAGDGVLVVIGRPHLHVIIVILVKAQVDLLIIRRDRGKRQCQSNAPPVCRERAKQSVTGVIQASPQIALVARNVQNPGMGRLAVIDRARPAGDFGIAGVGSDETPAIGQQLVAVRVVEENRVGADLGDGQGSINGRVGHEQSGQLIHRARGLVMKNRPRRRQHHDTETIGGAQRRAAIVGDHSRQDIRGGPLRVGQVPGNDTVGIDGRPSGRIDQRIAQNDWDSGGKNQVEPL